MNTKTMKQVCLLFAVALVFDVWAALPARAQNAVAYTYNAAGNRIKREIVLSPSAAKSAAANPGSSQQIQTFTETLGQQQILIYPNPTQGQLRIEIKGSVVADSTALYLFDLSGQQLISRQQAGSNTLLDLAAYPQGTYVLKIVLGRKTSQWKIIRE